MKKLVLTLSLVAALMPAQAQLFSPEAWNGAFFGSWIGGLAGSDCHNGFSGEGAAIGAGIGLLAGAVTGAARRQNYYEPAGYAYTPAPAVSVGYGYSGGGSSAYVHYAPNSYTAPGYYYRPARPNYAIGGTLLGAASGALIGLGNDQAGEGAAIGAAAGLVLGGIAEHSARRQERRFATTQTATQVQQAEPARTEPSTTIQATVARSEITSQPGATSTYTWTPRPQIADAPRVPDAPTF